MIPTRDAPGGQTPSTLSPARTGKGLPDHVRPGLRVLFVGINPGMRSEQLGHHFAGYSNRFWKLLRESRLVPEPIGPQDDVRLLDWGYGITNLVRRATPGIEDLEPADYEAGRRRLVALIRRNHPAIVALVGVTLYRVLFSAQVGASVRRRAGPAPPPLGLRDQHLGGAPVFVLPNPSGRNANFSYEEMLAAFRELRQRVPRV